MKSNFLKLCSMLTSVVMLAAVGCTDQLAEDITNVAGDVDAVEKTLADLQSKYAALEKAQDDLEAVVALKANAADLDAKVKEVKDAVSAIENALKGKADADKVSALETTVSGLQSQVTDLQTALEAAQKELAKYATTEALDATKKDLQDKITALETAVKTLQGIESATPEDVAEATEAIEGLKTTVAGVEATVKSLNDKIAAAEKDIVALQDAQADIKKSVEDILKRLEVLEKIDFEAYQTADDVVALIKANVKEADLSGLATSEELEAANDAIKAAGEAITEINNMLNGLIDELYETIQSLVFVPEYDDLCVTLYKYTINNKAISTQATVKATYKVTPTYLVNQIEEGVFTPYVLAKGLKTRAAADGIEAEEVFLSNFNDVTGTFDVEAVFDAEDVNANTAVALYLVDENRVALEEDIDDDFTVGGETLDLLENAYSSAYTKLALASDCELEFALYNGTDVYDPEQNVYEIEWSDKNNARTPLKGYTPHIVLDKKYYTLAEAAEILHVDVNAITPLYADEVSYYYDATAEDAEDCKAQVVTAGKNVVEREIKINGEVTKTTAKNFVKHMVTVEGEFYFQQGRTKFAVIEDVDYSYEIVNRKINVTLEDVKIDWSYKLAESLSSEKTAAKAYDKALNGTHFEELEEVTMTTTLASSEGYDVKAILAGTADYTYIGSTKANDLQVTADLVSHIDAQIASVEVTGYKAYWGKKLAIKNIYNVADDYTDIVLNWNLELGALPKATSVSYDYTGANALPLNSTGIVKKNIEIVKDFYGAGVAGFENLAQFNSNDGFFAGLTTTANAEILPKGDETKAKAPQNSNTYIRNWGPAADLQYFQIDTQVELVNATDLFSFHAEYTPWYYSDVNAYRSFRTYKVDVLAEVKIPAYTLETESIWVVDGVATVPGHVDATTGKWVINDAKLNTYVNVLGVAKTSTDELFIKWTVTAPEHKTTENYMYTDVPAPSASTSAFNNAAQTIAESIVTWGSYSANILDVKASLMMKKYPGDTKGVEIASEEFVLETKPMIVINADPLTAVERNDNNAVTASFAKGLSIYGLDNSDGSIDYETVNGEKVQRNFVAANFNNYPLYDDAINKYGLDLVFSETDLYVEVDGKEYALSTTNYTLDADFATTGKVTFISNDAVLGKDVTFVTTATVTYDRDYNKGDEVVVRLTFKAPKN